MPAESAGHRARLCVAGLSGGGGKTLFSLGLARTLVADGVRVKPFKKGPDYIDAAWLSLACGLPATNLDLFFLEPAKLRALFLNSTFASSADFALVEGNRGLFDGLDVDGVCSTAELARFLACPVLLILDVAKMTRTAAALLQGMQHFESGIDFCGVILNRVGSSRHAGILRQTIEKYTNIPILGALPRLSVNPLPERHMGISSRGPSLAEDADARLEAVAAHIRRYADVAAIRNAAASVRPLPELDSRQENLEGENLERCAAKAAVRVAPKPTIGYVLDAAFWFYYEENLRALSDAGAKLTQLSLLDRGRAQASMCGWEKLDGLYLGGGFPEDFAFQLSRSPLLPLLGELANNGLPIYAECGGLMLLAKKLVRQEEAWPMAAIFPMTVEFCDRPQGLGYVEGTVRTDNPFFPAGLRLRGHEFHYSRCRWDEAMPETVLQLERGVGMGTSNGTGHDGLLHNNTWGSYTHIFAPAVPAWARNFVGLAMAYHRRGEM